MLTRNKVNAFKIQHYPVEEKPSGTLELPTAIGGRTMPEASSRRNRPEKCRVF